MFTSIANNKLKYLLGATLMIVLALAFTTRPSLTATKNQQASATQEQARRDASSASWHAAQAETSLQLGREAAAARYRAMSIYYAAKDAATR